MASKSRFVGVRFEPEQQRKLIVLSMVAGEPGNMSAALRYLVERAPMPTVEGAGQGRKQKRQQSELIQA